MDRQIKNIIEACVPLSHGYHIRLVSCENKDT